MNQLESIQFVLANMGDSTRFDSEILSLIADIAAPARLNDKWSADELQRQIDDIIE